MIRYRSQKQLSFDDFDTPFEQSLNPENRWVKLAACIPWDALAEAYYQNFSSNKGRPAKDARLVIGAVIIKHKLCLSDEETVRQIQENPYLQFFVGFAGYQPRKPFAPSLFVDIRRRMGDAVFEQFHQAIVDAVVEKRKRSAKDQNEGNLSTPELNDGDAGEDDPGDSTGGSAAGDDCAEETAGTHQGKLILDATVAEQAIRFPTDLNLLNEAREISERLVDVLYASSDLTRKPRTYRQKARQAYLAVVKQRRPSARVRRHGIRQQLQYLRRNLGHIERLLDDLGRMPLSERQLRQYWIIQHVYEQQAEMYRTRRKRCDHRIVSIHQPHVRPIVRGKQNKAAEFGAKLSVSLNGDGLARVDALRWEAFHEGRDLAAQVEAYRERYGCYPEVVLADPLYGTRENRNYLKKLGIRFAGKPLGRPKKETAENSAQLREEKRQHREEYRQRIPIEGKFGQGKNGYGLNRILAKTAATSEAWINSIFLVMNLLVLLRVFCARKRLVVAQFIRTLQPLMHEFGIGYREYSTGVGMVKSATPASE